MTDIIAVDSMVCRKSGGPMMLVMAVLDDGALPVARCAWFDGQKLEGATIAIDQLDLMSAS